MATVEYDEFGLFQENAEEYDIPWRGPPAVRREFVEVGDGRRVSALVWGDADPDLVLVHGGAQNAHTWDTVALALDRPLVAVDLPGHGHSDWREDRRYWPVDNAKDVATAIRALAPSAAPRGRHVARRAHVGRARGAPSRAGAAADARRRDTGRRPRQGGADRGVRRRARAVRVVRRDPRAHRRLQPDTHRVVAAARHPAQRPRAATTAAGRGGTTAGDSARARTSRTSGRSGTTCRSSRCR